MGSLSSRPSATAGVLHTALVRADAGVRGHVMTHQENYPKAKQHPPEEQVEPAHPCPLTAHPPTASPRRGAHQPKNGFLPPAQSTVESTKLLPRWHVSRGRRPHQCCRPRRWDGAFGAHFSPPKPPTSKLLRIWTTNFSPFIKSRLMTLPRRTREPPGALPT